MCWWTAVTVGSLEGGEVKCCEAVDFSSLQQKTAVACDISRRQRRKCG